MVLKVIWRYLAKPSEFASEVDTITEGRADSEYTIGHPQWSDSPSDDVLRRAIQFLLTSGSLIRQGVLTYKIEHNTTNYFQNAVECLRNIYS